MTRRSAIAVLALALAATVWVPGTAETAAAADTLASPRACNTWWKATERVPVRRPAWNDGPVATTRSPVHHYLRRGERVRSCREAIARTESGPAYRACGGQGHIWQIVPGGQVPRACLKRA